MRPQRPDCFNFSHLRREYFHSEMALSSLIGARLNCLKLAGTRYIFFNTNPYHLIRFLQIHQGVISRCADGLLSPSEATTFVLVNHSTRQSSAACKTLPKNQHFRPPAILTELLVVLIEA
jgi:hypothetical protein